MNKTSKIDDKLLLKSVREGYCKARSMVGNPGFAGEDQYPESRLLSAKFVAEVSDNIHQCIFKKKYHLNVIKIYDNGKTESGEWLVDACITRREPIKVRKEEREFIAEIVFAMESESNTSWKAFHEDFAKLVHLKASYKLYLNGLNQTTPEGVEDYIVEQLDYAKRFLNKEDADTFYFGFWPAPGQLKPRGPSAWKEFERYPHLNQIHLYKFTQGSFQQIQ